MSLPDIDIDFCERRRGEVIEYVTRKYGRENVAQIITFGTMKAKAAVRDVARALDIPLAEANKVAKLIPAALDMSLAKAVEENPALKELEQNDPQVKELLTVARRLEGMTRHASTHAAGVVIAPRPITEFAPLYKGGRDEIVTQWAMKEVERMGLLKMDFLGLSTLTLIHDALEEIERTTGAPLDIDAIPLDDAKTYQLFADGQTYGIFQFESSGMRDILRRAKPQRLDDLIAMNALYRPGPLRSGMVDDYIARKQGTKEIKYELPQLEPILSDTYGVIAYQEQVMRIAATLASFSLGQSDLLRKAMGKKNPAVMQAQREKFVHGALANGINEKRATKIFDLMEHFAGYGFNKSHSTAYAYLAYQTAYLKANYPWHFAAALLTIEAQNTDKLALYLGECRDRGIPVLPPDVNESELRFTVTPAGVRFGLTAVKNVGEQAILTVLEHRRACGRLGSLPELCEGVDLRVVNKRVLESLVKSGAADSLGQSQRGRGAAAARGCCGPGCSPRSMRRWSTAAACSATRTGGRPTCSAAATTGTTLASAVPPLPDAPAWSEIEQLNFEHEALGVFWSGHPIDSHAADLREYGARTIAELAPGDAALPDRRGRPSRRRGHCRRTATMSWSPGSSPACARSRRARATAWACSRSKIATAASRSSSTPRPYARFERLIENGALVVVRGRLDKDDEESRLYASEIAPIETVRERLARELAITVAVPPHGRRTFEALAELFDQHRGDKPVTLQLEIRERRDARSACGPRCRRRSASSRRRRFSRRCRSCVARGRSCSGDLDR